MLGFLHCFNDYEGEKNWVGTHILVSCCARDVVGSPFYSGVVTLSNTVDNSRNVAAYGTAHEKRMYGVCGPVQEMYVSCISGFPCRMYIDSNHCDSRI
jgi:hypothetical protein